jgi:hypothetical protein
MQQVNNGLVQVYIWTRCGKPIVQILDLESRLFELNSELCSEISI